LEEHLDDGILRIKLETPGLVRLQPQYPQDFFDLAQTEAGATAQPVQLARTAIDRSRFAGVHQLLSFIGDGLALNPVLQLLPVQVTDLQILLLAGSRRGVLYG